MEEGFRVGENTIIAEKVTANFNYNNNITIGGQATNYNNNNNGDQSTNNNTNNVELEGRKRSKSMPTSSSNAENSSTRGVRLLTTELMGEAFKIKNDEIWSLLRKDEVRIIGVWGMGGVGKTALMKSINNQIFECRDIFSHVYWVTVSRDSKTDKIQDHIAKAIEFELSKDDGEQKRAAKLHDELMERKKFVLILDDLWEYLDENKVGIPLGKSGCKMIFTTRLLNVCQQMDVCNENIIKVEPLLKNEAWRLFKKELGRCNTELKPLAKAVARECAGLPLGLKTMARSMKGKYEMRDWKNALKELKEAKKRCAVESNLFSVLKYSYDCLEDLTKQECFLYCAFFPEDFMIRRDELIEYLIVEGIIKREESPSREEQHDEGHVILNELENACLLERCVDFEENICVKMHDLIRDMAIKILRERSLIMIKAGVQLEEVPDVEDWIDSLVRVSLMENDIVEIPSSHSPRCPNLATLLLRSNKDIKLISNSFFKQVYGLKVLDLSDTWIVTLADSISELVNLVALLLGFCRDLKYIPSLAKLSKLQKLDISYTEITELPNGMDMLSSLRYLNFWESKVKELRSGILPNLSRLQVLITRISVTGKEVACLSKLERLKCNFSGISDFRECMEHLSLPTYNIEIGDCSFLHDYGDLFDGYVTAKCVTLGEICISTEQEIKAFPENIEVLHMGECRLPRTLFGDGIRNSVSLPCHTFKNAVISGSLQSVGRFSCLKRLVIERCSRLKRLFSIGLLSTFQNLECVEVRWCDRMEEIQAMKGDEHDEEKEDDDEEEEEDDDDDDEDEEDDHEEEDDDDDDEDEEDDDDDKEEEEEEDDDDDKEDEEEEEEEDNDDEEQDDDNYDEKEEENGKGGKNNSSNPNLPVECIRLPKLKRLQLIGLPKLKSICSGVMICDSLQEIEIVRCERLKRIPLSYPLPYLEKIVACPGSWWKSVEWNQLTHKNIFQSKLEFS